MDLNHVEARITEYSELELFLRDFFQKNKRLPAIDEYYRLLSFFDQADDNIHTQVELSEYVRNIKELNIKSNRDITIIKHPRYSCSYKHKHEFIEVIYMYHGKSFHEIGSKTFRLNEGEICIISPDTDHSFYVNDDSIAMLLLIKISNFDKAFYGLLRNKNILSDYFSQLIFTNRYSPYLIVRAEQNDNLKEIILKMVQVQDDDDNLTNYMLNSYLSLFFAYVLHNYKQKFELINTHNNFTSISSILLYIQENYRDVTLTSLAQNFHFAEAYLSRMIKICTNNNFVDLLNSIRLKKASELLINSSLSIKDICIGVGYKNLAYFSRLFKKTFALNPSEYREQNNLK